MMYQILINFQELLGNTMVGSQRTVHFSLIKNGPNVSFVLNINKHIINKIYESEMYLYV